MEKSPDFAKKLILLGTGPPSVNVFFFFFFFSNLYIYSIIIYVCEFCLICLFSDCLLFFFVFVCFY